MDTASLEQNVERNHVSTHGRYIHEYINPQRRFDYIWFP